VEEAVVCVWLDDYDCFATTTTSTAAYYYYYYYYSLLCGAGTETERKSPPQIPPNAWYGWLLLQPLPPLPLLLPLHANEAMCVASERQQKRILPAECDWPWWHSRLFLRDSRCCWVE
jgi:hypothetical protein